MNKREPIAWMVYTVDGQSAYVTDNRQHWPEAVKARAAIKKVEGENHAKSL